MSDADVVLVKFKSHVSSNAANGFRNKHKLSDIEDVELAKIGFRKFSVPPGQAAKFATDQSTDEDVETIEADGRGQGSPITPNDPKFASQWHLTKINADDAWEDSMGDPSVIIGSVDTGLQYDHPDLAANAIRGNSYVTGVSSSDDDHGHGTATGGTAIAVINNALGVAGVSPKCRLRMNKGLDSTNWGYFSWWAAAIINHADYPGMKVIFISAGGNNGSSALQSACQYARNKGIPVVAAAGNNGNTTPQYPAAYSNVISVSATDQSNNLAGWSSRGYINIAAPGVGILTTHRGSGYASWGGTSFSCPIVAGVLALIRTVNKDLSDVDAINVLYTSATDLSNTTNFGVGLVDADAAVIEAASATPSNPPAVVAPSISITSPASGATVSGAVQITANVGGDNLTTVTLKVDGATITSGIPVSGTTFSVTWASSGVSDGSRTISLVLNQTGGATATATRTVNVLNAVDVTPPTCTITNPSGNVTVKKKGIIKVQVSASDARSTPIIKTYINGVLRKQVTSTTSQYIWKYFNAPIGANTITATATDAAGNVSPTASRTVTKTG